MAGVDAPHGLAAGRGARRRVRAGARFGSWGSRPRRGAAARPAVTVVGEGCRRISPVRSCRRHAAASRREWAIRGRPGDRAAATGDRVARSRHDGVGRDGHGRRSGPGAVVPGPASAVRGGRRRRREQWWHRRVTGEDSGAMVLTELLPMPPTKGLDTSRVGFIGWSMGGYGSLLARRAAWSGADRRDLRGRPLRCTRTTAQAIEAGAFDGRCGLVRVLGVRRSRAFRDPHPHRLR